MKLRINVGEVYSAKVQMSKVNGTWQPPRLILGVVKEIGQTDYVSDPNAKVSPMPVIKVWDVLCNLPNGEGHNELHPTKGITNLNLPWFVSKHDINKAGPMFSRAVDFIDGVRTNKARRPLFERRVNGAWTEVDNLDDADRVTVYLHAEFNIMKTQLETATRLARVRDAEADGGWRVATPWRQSAVRAFPTEEGVNVDCVVERLSVVPILPLKLDRAPRTIQPALAADKLGEAIL